MSNTNHDVAHLWANQSKPRARSSNGNFSFDGDTIYSYSTPIARLILGDDGKPVACLRTTHRYSITTTSKHETAISYALRGDLPVIYVPNVSGSWGGSIDHTRNLASFTTRIADGAATARRSSLNAEWRWDGVQKLVEQGNRYRALFSLETPEFTMPDGWQGDLAKARERAQKILHPDPASLDRRERERARRIQRKQEREAEQARLASLALADKIAAWKAGENVGWLPWNAPMTLRLQPGHPETLETSRGARVPVEDAKRVFALAQHVRGEGRDWEPHPVHPKVGDYRLDRIDADGTIHAGCHTIPWEESARMAATLGLIEAPAEEVTA